MNLRRPHESKRCKGHYYPKLNTSRIGDTDGLEITEEKNRKAQNILVYVNGTRIHINRKSITCGSFAVKIELNL